jgi:hypothetical protein
MPITVTAPSKAWNVFARSNIGIVSSNPNQSMGVRLRLFYIRVLLCKVAAMLRADPPSKGPTDCVKDKETEKAARV